MKIYTKKGDSGTTTLIGGRRVPKYHLRIDAYGTVDELMAFTANLADHPQMDKYSRDKLIEILDRLMTCASILAKENPDDIAKIPEIYPSDIEMLENEIDLMERNLPPLTSFILPAGHELVSRSHIARTVCRRAERLATRVNDEVHQCSLVVKYLNRLSDYFFVMSRKQLYDNKLKEFLWKPKII